MTGLDFVLLAMVIIASFVLRALPSIRKQEFGNDAYYHLLVARSIRAHRRFPEKDTGMAPDGPRGYPPFFHLLLIPFAGRFEKLAKRAVSPSIDAITIAIVFLFSDSIGISEPIWPTLIFAFSPICVLQSTSLNPRPLSCLILAVSMLSIFWYWSTEAVLALVVALVFESLMFLTHKMGVQALVAAHIAASVVIALDDLPTGLLAAAVLPGAFLVAIGLTRGAYLRTTLKDHIGFIRVHIRHGDYRTGRKGLPSPMELLKSDPISYAAPVAGLYLLVDGGSSMELEFLVAWALGVVILTQFWMLGDSWRHLAFGNIPSSIISVMFVYHLVGSDWAGRLLLLLLTVALVAATVIQLKRALRSDTAQTIVNGIRGLPQEWKERLRGSFIYSNAVHNAVPLETGATLLGGNPNAIGVEFSLELHRANKRSLAAVAELAGKTIGSEPEYYVVFERMPYPDTSGYTMAYESDEIRILVKEDTTLEAQI
jgi:hypothetical protein